MTYFVIHPKYVNVLDANHRVQSSHDLVSHQTVPSIPFHKFSAPMTCLILCKLPLSKISSPYYIHMFVKLKRIIELGSDILYQGRKKTDGTL